MLRFLGPAVGITLLLAGCSSTSSTEDVQPVSISGTIHSVVDTTDVLEISSFQAGSKCTSGADTSVVSGAQVVLLEASGTVVGVGTLGEGTLIRPDSLPNYLCEMGYTIDVSSLKGELFTLRIANRDHEMTYKLEELEASPITMIGEFYWH